MICQHAVPLDLVDKFIYWRSELEKAFLKEYDKANGNGTFKARELAETYMVIQEFNMENFLKKSAKYSPFMDNSSAALKDYESLKKFDLSGLERTKEAEERERFEKFDREKKFEGEVKAKSSEWKQFIDKQIEVALAELKEVKDWVNEAKTHPSEGRLNWLYNNIDKRKDLIHGVFGIKSPPAKCETSDPVKFFSEVPVEYEDMLVPTYFKQPFELDYTVADCLRHYLPQSLRQKVLTTDTNEDMVMVNYAKSGSVPSDVLAAYNEAKKEERQLLKQFAGNGSVCSQYVQTLTKGRSLGLHKA